jgi:hypothetical protein
MRQSRILDLHQVCGIAAADNPYHLAQTCRRAADGRNAVAGSTFRITGAGGVTPLRACRAAMHADQAGQGGFLNMPQASRLGATASPGQPAGKHLQSGIITRNPLSI